jgi:hypothetical protein
MRQVLVFDLVGLLVGCHFKDLTYDFVINYYLFGLSNRLK